MNKRERAKALNKLLISQGFPTVCIYGKMEQTERYFLLTLDSKYTKDSRLTRQESSFPQKFSVEELISKESILLLTMICLRPQMTTFIEWEEREDLELRDLPSHSSLLKKTS